ncbi:MAG: peptidoglycan-binding protein [Ruminococcaceae bacterium]|nr:peptidoglycan-binding protein [Oscillospiraceae bacterium]
MNFIDQKEEVIKDVQKWLRTIGREYPDFPEVFIDGIYGSETAEAVAFFQRKKGLQVTGNIDRETFDSLYSEYLRIIRASRILGFIPKFEEYTEGEMRPGDVLDDIFVLQLLLRAVSLDDNDLFVEINGVFNEETEKAVRKLQNKIGMTENGRVNGELWNMLVLLADKQKFNI